MFSLSRLKTSNVGDPLEFVFQQPKHCSDTQKQNNELCSDLRFHAMKSVETLPNPNLFGLFGKELFNFDWKD